MVIRKILALAAGLLVLVMTLLAVLEGLPLPDHTRLWQELRNAGHLPLFGLFALLVFWLTGVLTRGYLARSKSYVIAAVTTAVVATASELLQYDGPRDADPWDLARDLVGIVVFLGVAAIHDRELSSFWQKQGRQKRRLFNGILIMVCAIALAPVAYWGALFAGRNARFPTILDAESVLEMPLLKQQDTRIEQVPIPPGFVDGQGARVLKVTFFTSHCSGVRIEDLYPDWRGFEALSLAVYSELDRPVKLGVKIQDRHYKFHLYDRYRGGAVIAPGSNRIVIPLNDMAKLASGRSMAFEDMSTIVLFVSHHGGEFPLLLDDLKLIRSD